MELIDGGIINGFRVNICGIRRLAYGLICNKVETNVIKLKQMQDRKFLLLDRPASFPSFLTQHSRRGELTFLGSGRRISVHEEQERGDGQHGQDDHEDLPGRGNAE